MQKLQTYKETYIFKKKVPKIYIQIEKSIRNAQRILFIQSIIEKSLHKNQFTNFPIVILCRGRNGGLP
jgi:hypothetical protein